MRRGRRPLLAAMPMIVVLLLLAGCAGKLSFSEQLRGAIDGTTKLPRHFVYTEKHAGTTIVVNGDFEDDLRYAASLSIDGKPVAAEVMRDDARALKLSADVINKLGLYKNAVAPTTPQENDALSASDAATPAPGTTDPTPDPRGAVIPPVSRYAAQRPHKSSLDLLSQGFWVVDPKGAGPLGRLRQSARAPQIGDDPIADALTVLTYVRDVSNVGDFARLFNSDAVDYRPDLDPFPPPAQGEIRVDFQPGGAPARVPTATGTTDALQNAVPDTYYYRSLSIYVKDGVIQRIRESVNVKRRLLADPADDILGRITDAGVKVPDSVRNGSIDQQAAFVLKVKNQFNAQHANPLIRERELSVDFSYSAPPPTVSLPVGAISGFLGGIAVRGEIVDQGTVQ
jgi:hypothetical protein